MPTSNKCMRQPLCNTSATSVTHFWIRRHAELKIGKSRVSKSRHCIAGSQMSRSAHRHRKTDIAFLIAAPPETSECHTSDHALPGLTPVYVQYAEAERESTSQEALTVAGK
ncbi:hypothetical protein ABBQ38_010116 [Trebouxia sp. C0009 RCD-2024]